VAELARNREYRRGVWAMAAASVPIAPAAAIGVALLGSRWRPEVVRLARSRPWRAGLVFGAGLALTLAVVALPLGIARYAWGRRYGLVTQRVWSWLADVGKAALIEAVIFAAVGLVLAVLLCRAPRLWWAGLAALVALLVYGLALLSPLVLEPLFQKTAPLDDRALAAEVLDIARKSGVEARDVKVTDASRRTTAANAYVSGLGASRHVVLYDTLLRDFPRDQIRTVVAHELAHVAKRHVAKGTTWGAALAAPLCLGLFALVGWRTGWGRPSQDADGTDLVLRRLALVAAGAITLAAVSAPIGNTVSRAYESEAEWSALQVTGDAKAAIGLQQGLVRQNLGVPDPPAWVRLWFGTHPTALERIGLAKRVER
jgi:STE24 endopeptidase